MIKHSYYNYYYLYDFFFNNAFTMFKHCFGHLAGVGWFGEPAIRYIVFHKIELLELQSFMHLIL